MPNIQCSASSKSKWGIGKKRQAWPDALGAPDIKCPLTERHKCHEAMKEKQNWDKIICTQASTIQPKLQHVLFRNSSSCSTLEQAHISVLLLFVQFLMLTDKSSTISLEKALHSSWKQNMNTGVSRRMRWSPLLLEILLHEWVIIFSLERALGVSPYFSTYFDLKQA